MRNIILNRIQKIFLLINAVLTLFPIYAKNYQQPTETAGLVSGAGLLLASELFKAQIAPSNPRWTNGNTPDDAIREKLIWSTGHLQKAALAGDILLYGVMLPSVFWQP